MALLISGFYFFLLLFGMKVLYALSFGMKVLYALSFFVPVIRRIHVRFLWGRPLSCVKRDRNDTI